MIRKLDDKILALKRVAGVEVQLLPEGKILYYLVVLAKQKNVIAAEVKIAAINDLEELKKHIPAQTPLALVLNGRGIINRKIKDTNIESDVQILSNLLPNAKQEDFYLQKFISGNNLFASVIRKETYEEVQSSFIAKGFTIINASTGPFIFQTIAPFLSKNLEEVSAGGFSFDLKNGVVFDFKVKGEGQEAELTVGEEKISSSLALAYSIALSEFIKGAEDCYISSETLQLNKEEYSNKELFKMYGYGILAFFVVILLANYLCYSHFKSESRELQARSGNHRQTIEEVEMLQKKVDEKEYFMKSAGWFSSPKTSFYADDIASTIPSSIRLTGLKVNPLNEKISKKERKDVFRSDTIVVSGICNNPTVLNPWMGTLKDRKWIKSLSHLNYEHDPKTGSGIFEIEIRVNDGL